MTDLSPMIPAAIILGAVAGAYGNVFSLRRPRDEGGYEPPACPACGRPLPRQFAGALLASFRGAGCCGARPWGAAAAAVFASIFLALLLRPGPPLAIAHWAMAALLAIGACTDLRWRIIPDRVTLGGAALGLALSAAMPSLHGVSGHIGGLWRAAVGAAVPAALLWAIGAAGSLAFRREAMGLGDVKLLACLGAFLGWEGGLFSIGAGSVIGALFGCAWIAARRARGGPGPEEGGTEMPFGPALMAAGLLWPLGGDAWWGANFGPAVAAVLPWMP